MRNQPIEVDIRSIFTIFLFFEILEVFRALKKKTFHAMSFALDLNSRAKFEASVACRILFLSIRLTAVGRQLLGTQGSPPFPGVH